MNPPGIGDALTVGWEKFKENPVPILVAMFCAWILGLIPIVGGFLAVPGMMLVGLKAVRGEVPEPKDGFVGLQAAVDNIVMGLLQVLGLIACCIGIYVTQGIFLPGTGLIVDKGMSWSDAKDRCMEQIKPQWVSWTLFVFVMGLVAGLGALACIVGVLVTAPVAVIGLAYAYDQTLGRG
jgi:hypothetical protein